MNNKLISATLAAVGTVVLGGVVYAQTETEPEQASGDLQSPIVEAIEIRPTEVIKGVEYIEVSYPTDYSDDRKLVGASHNVFTAKVLRQINEKDRGLGLETQFEVEIIDNVKGDIASTVVVNQQGGVENGVLYIFGDRTENKQEGYLLEPGSTYVLATRYSQTNDWYTLNTYPSAKELITSDSNKSSTDLKVESRANGRVEALNRAYEREILLKADVERGNTRNAYGSQQQNSAIESTSDSVIETATTSQEVSTPQEI